MVSPLRENVVIGDWRLNRPLGQGGQGPVWLVRPTTSKRSPPRALKACFAEDDVARKRFEREIELLGACRSPHILDLIEAKPDWVEHLGGYPPFAYFVAEWCEGSLFDLDKKNRLGDQRQRLHWFGQACESVVVLHERPEQVIHRDIKPENFLLAQEPVRVVLADFGIARLADARSDVTATHEVVGTQLFRAPEVHHGHSDVRSDVYSLGRLLEWLMTGDVSRDLGARVVPRGGELSDAACEALDRIIVKATQAVAGNRFASVRDLVDCLPQLWIDLKPAPRKATSTGMDVSTVLSTAFEFARARDHLGWRQLETQLRRAYPVQLDEWRHQHEKTPALPDKDQKFAFVDHLVRAAQSRLAFALAGVYQQQQLPEFVDQRRTLGDLLNVPGWPQAGRTVIVEGLRTLAFVFHHLHGAVCCDINRPDLALQLAAVELPHKRNDAPWPLWRQHDLTNYPEVIRHLTESWDYLRSLPDRFEFLGSFFALRKDFDIALASYSMLLSLLEFAHDAPKLQSLAADNFSTLSFDSNPMFLAMETDVVHAAAGRIFGSRDVTDLVIARTGASRQLLRSLWPQWQKAYSGFRSRLRHGFYFGEDVSLGDLA